MRRYCIFFSSLLIKLSMSPRQGELLGQHQRTDTTGCGTAVLLGTPWHCAAQPVLCSRLAGEMGLPVGWCPLLLAFRSGTKLSVRTARQLKNRLYFTCFNSRAISELFFSFNSSKQTCTHATILFLFPDLSTVTQH